MVTPIPKPAPGRGPSARGAAIGDIHPDALPVFIHEPTLEGILCYSEKDPARELGGFLVGGLHEDRRHYVEVRHFLPAVDAHCRAASLTFTHDTWSRLNREVEAKYPDELVVGWHHTHPNFGVFLSGYDLFIHRHFFSEPWQIAMVVDPQRREFGFFQWREGEIADCGFVCVPG
jgi:proteasome lid subunit RPN8/RPN11